MTVKSLIAGYIELKSPGTGANTERFKRRNKEQWNKFKNLPNLIYTDGNEWALYRDGKLSGKIIKLSGEVTTDGKKAIEEEDAEDSSKDNTTTTTTGKNQDVQIVRPIVSPAQAETEEKSFLKDNGRIIGIVIAEIIVIGAIVALVLALRKRKY